MARQQNDGIFGSMIPGSALEPNRLVKVSAGTLVYCTATASDRPIGLTMERADAAGDIVKFKYINAPGTFLMSAASTISAGALAYPAAAGQVWSTAAGSILGTAMQAAGAANDLIEVIPTYQTDAT